MAEPHPKRAFLEAVGALHAHPEHVCAPLFERHRFFDPLDKVQVKYEMLRAHAVEGQTVVAVSEAFGFSRQTFYTTLRAFEELGIVGLTDEKRGRRGRVKLSEDDVAWVEVLARKAPDPLPEVFGYHEVWHAATLGAAALHLLAVDRVTRRLR